MIKFTDIEQLRNVISDVRSNYDFQGKDENNTPIYKHLNPYPIISFLGTIKCNGSNASIILYKDGHYEFQSRDTILTEQEDSIGFRNAIINTPYQQLFNNIKFNEYCAIYGEWYLLFNNTKKKSKYIFVIFAVKIDDVYQNFENYKHLQINENNIYNILQFPTYNIDIDFNSPDESLLKLQELTTQVENKCPISEYFDMENIGEGIVWESKNTDNGKRYIFKVKGKKHQSSQISYLVSTYTEKIEDYNQFVEYACTENRLKQGIDKMKEFNYKLDKSSTGKYLSWIVKDIYKEESDTIMNNNLEENKINKLISTTALKFWSNYLDSIY